MYIIQVYVWNGVMKGSKICPSMDHILITLSHTYVVIHLMGSSVVYIHNHAVWKMTTLYV